MKEIFASNLSTSRKMNSSREFKKQNHLMQSLEAKPMKREPLINNQPSESYGNALTKLPNIARNSSKSQLDHGGIDNN